MRHRERVREREKREKLRKAGKLNEYLKNPEKNVKKLMKEPKPNPVDITLQQYKETKKLSEGETELVNYSKLDVDETKVELIVNRIRRKKKLVKEWAQLEKKELEVEQQEPQYFKPRMAGKTGLPVFFFSNLVSQSRSCFLKADTRNRMHYKTFAHNK